MNLKIMINLKDVNDNGKVYKEEEFEANSLVQGFIGVLAVQMNLGGSQAVIRTTGSSYSSSSDAQNFNISSAAGDATQGIVVGTSGTAVSVSNYCLGSLISHGTSTGQLEYSANEMPTLYTVSGSDAYFELRRTFTNSSGADITINEIGLYVQYYVNAYYICIDRTVTTKTVTAGNGIVVTYRFQVSV